MLYISSRKEASSHQVKNTFIETKYSHFNISLLLAMTNFAKIFGNEVNLDLIGKPDILILTKAKNGNLQPA